MLIILFQRWVSLMNIMNHRLFIILPLNNIQTADFYKPDAWAHLAFTWDRQSKTIAVYQDGNILATDKIGSFPHLLPSQSKPTLQNINIGRNEKRNYHFSGFIKEVRLRNRSLTQEEIRANYLFDRSKTYQGLIAYWPLDDGNYTLIIGNHLLPLCNGE